MADSKFKYIGEGIVGAAAIAVVLLTPLLQARLARWGATDAEVRHSLPGDDLVPHPKVGYTYAITINTPAAKIWPWLVQIGQGRGGFYSYEFLENMVGCQIHNADRIIPEFQHLEVGDGVRLHPKAPPLPVAAIEPGRVIVLYAGEYAQNAITWVFFLDELDEGTTRLIARFRFDCKPSLGNMLGYGFFLEPISCLMQRKMFLGIKRRAEAGTSS